MTDNNKPQITEKRKYPRFEGGEAYTGIGPQGRVLGRAANKGPGGAFLETNQLLRPGSYLLLQVAEPFDKLPPVILAARVVYNREKPKRGIGIRWHKALGPNGLEHLRRFLDNNFHLILDPQLASAYTKEELEGIVVFDFVTGKVFTIEDTVFPRLEDAESVFGLKLSYNILPKAQFVDVKAIPAGLKPGPPGGISKEDRLDEQALTFIEKYSMDVATTQPVELEPLTEESSQHDSLDAWRAQMKLRKKTKTPVTLQYGGLKFPAMVRNISSGAMFVLFEGVKPAIGDRVVVYYPITLNTRSATVAIMGEISRAARDSRRGMIGIDIKILSVSEGKQPGIFSEYLVAL